LLQRQGRIGKAHHQVEGLAERRHHGADRCKIVQARSVQDVSAGGFECLQPPNRIVEIVATVQEILCSGGQGEGNWQRSRDFDRSLHPFDREGEVINWPLCIAGGIFDRASDSACLGRKPDRFGCGFRRICATVLQIDSDRQVGMPAG
jgi:hypothetical protein